MNHPQSPSRQTPRLGGLVALLVLTGVCFAVRSTLDQRPSTSSDQHNFGESPDLIYGRLLGRYKKLLHLLERIEQSEGSPEQRAATDQYNQLAGEYNELMESMAFPFTERSQVPPSSPGPLPRYVSLREQQ